MGQVQGKIALVTGAASGIGAACAKLLACEGAVVVATDIDDEGGHRQLMEIRQAGGEATYFHHDVTSETSWAEVVSEIERRHARLDILVSNAGISIVAPSIADVTLADWKRLMAVNLDGVFLSVKYCLPAMRRCGGGSIIIMSSTAGLLGSAAAAGYCATKGGVRLFAKAVAMECATVGDGIRVNSVHPGVIDTPIWGKRATGATAFQGGARLDVEQLAKRTIPLARAGQAREIANGVLFLASDASSYVTGTDLVIDGGMTGGRVLRSPPK